MPGDLTAAQVADVAQEKLAAHGYGDFARTEVRFAGAPGVALDFVTRNSKGTVVYRTREYFAVRGNAAFVLGMGSATWEEHLPLIEQIAGRFELARVDADLDTLATALFVKSDDLLKDSPQLAPYRPEVGITPRLSDAELVTLSVMQAMLDDPR